MDSLETNKVKREPLAKAPFLSSGDLGSTNDENNTQI